MYSQQQNHYPMENNSNYSYKYNQRPPLPPPHQQHYYPPIVPLEPTPSSTDAQPTPVLSIAQISEFASSVVFLMWHARRPSVMALHENSKSLQLIQTDDRHLVHSKETATIANKTSAAFKKFCKQILSATQLSESVILLSLKYIAMLLQNNPNIQGAEGSEYRLFTVALMLANKFLDDNTFTNKTWSEVSGMKVTDLNIMELEFLDVLRFKLFIRKEEYDRWKSSLFTLKNQLEEAQKHEQQQHQQHQQQILFDDTMKGIILPTIQQQQQQQQNQNLQLLYMFSKSTQVPQFPTQPLERPLTRRPLRIPLQPVGRLPDSSQSNPSNPSIQPIQNNNNNPIQPSQPSSIYDIQQVHQQQNVIRPSYIPNSNSNSSNNDFYNPQSQKPTISYDTYPTPNSTDLFHYQRPNIISPPSKFPPSAPPVNSNRISTHQEFNPLINSNPPYYKLTSSSNQPTTTDNTFYSNNSNPSYPPLRSRNSFYGDIGAQSTVDFTSYDMSGTQPSNDIYSRIQPPHVYQHPPQQQNYRPSNQLYNNNTNTRKYNGPVLEDPLTARDSYRSNQQQN